MTSAFTSREIVAAAIFAALLQTGFFTILVLAGQARGEIAVKEKVEPKPVPIKVKPVMDELPLLKLGSKKDMKPKLPDMWKKQAPVPVKRYEESSAPTEKAEDTPEAIPTSKLVEKDKEPPPDEDAETVKELDAELEKQEEEPEEAPQMNEEGAADGVAEGTETDPLKARAVDMYRRKILGWFNARFRPPQGEIPCEVLKALGASVAVQVGGDRTITGYSITSPSGNPIFDAKVKATLDGMKGQQLPPPPPLYPDILESTVYPRLSGAGVPCE